MNVLFLGDSITDAGRSRPDGRNLGDGYAALVADGLRKHYPDRHFDFTNRGNSGDRTGDILARIDADAIRLRPDLVVFMIGINDVWRRYDANSPTAPERFEANYLMILDAFRAGTTAKLVLLEPFLLDVPDKPFRDDLGPKLEIVRRIAGMRHLSLVRLDDLFRAAAAKQPPLYYSGDGIHPNREGALLIAKHCLKAVASIL